MPFRQSWMLYLSFVIMKDFVAPVSLAEPTEKDNVDSAALERVRTILP